MKKRILFPLAGICLASFGLSAQDWQVVDTFPDGEPEGTWASNGLPNVSTAEGYLSLRPTEGSNVTSTFYVELPQSFTSGKVTIAFDFYLPDGGASLNAAGFGVGSMAQAAGSGWGATGNRNRFQSVGDTSPQNLAKVPEWESDIFGTTELGVWYNIWLVYDLDASPNTVTAVTKMADLPMEEGNLITTTFEFNDTNNDDWSSIDVFATGIGLQDVAPEGQEAWDATGARFDNIYVSASENLTEKPVSVDFPWVEVDTFDEESPDATWSVQEGITVDFTDNLLFVTGTQMNAGLSTALPMVSDMRQSMTLTFDMMLPAGGTGLNHIQFGVVGADQEAASGAEFFGGNDRFITFGINSPQALANFGQWPPSLGPDLLGGTQLDTWYHVWLVYDGTANRVDFYAVPMGDPVDSVELPGEPVASFDLEVDYAAFSHFVLGVAQGGGDGVYLDNIYQSLGRNITLSPTAGDFDNTGPEVVSLWVDVEPANAEGDKLAGIGWINDVAYPFVWHYSIGGWTFVLDNFSSLENIWLYDYKNDAWYWANDAWGGWHVKLGDTEYGIDGWADWIE